MTIRGRFQQDTGRPFVEAYLELARLGVQHRVFLLLDTGADASLLMPSDAANMGLSL
jgi:predicted aspartyl protease